MSSGDAPKVKAFDKAVDLLTRRPHFTRQLRQKLEKRGYPAQEISAVEARLVEYGYLDDRKTALQYVESRIARGAEGARRIRAELTKRGAPPEAVEEALELLPKDDLAGARQAAESWRRNRAKINPQSLGRHLDRKGFSRRSIYTLLDELREELARSLPPE